MAPQFQVSHNEYVAPSMIDSYVKIVSLALEFRRGVDFVSHDSGNGLFNVLHPLHHLGLSHNVDILDEGIIFLPERHLSSGVLTVLP